MLLTTTTLTTRHTKKTESIAIKSNHRHHEHDNIYILTATNLSVNHNFERSDTNITTQNADFFIPKPANFSICKRNLNRQLIK